MNGTANFLLVRLSEGQVFDEAVREARALGFAEADPSVDVDGHDAADKLSLLVREAFGVALPPERIAKDTLRDVTAGRGGAARARGEVLQHVGRGPGLPDGRVEGGVGSESPLPRHPLPG